MYEQIYALAGPAQTYRVTGDPRILQRHRVHHPAVRPLFPRPAQGRILLAHRSDHDGPAQPRSLGRNSARKNWNSVGDHAPAYLINAVPRHRRAAATPISSSYTADTIEKHFPDYEQQPVRQRALPRGLVTRSHWGWQQNRAVVGHNLKIAWNLMRMQQRQPKRELRRRWRRRSREIMPAVGSDQQRGGWYDVVERTARAGPEGRTASPGTTAKRGGSRSRASSRT